jgi:hypothetical protein
MKDTTDTAWSASFLYLHKLYLWYPSFLGVDE